MSKGKDVLAALTTASAGLNYTSEKDAAFKAFLWEDLKKASLGDVLARAGVGEKDEVEEVKLAAFFKPLIVDQDWHGKDEKAQVKKFQALQKTLTELLTNLRVFKAGKARKKVVVVGKTTDGKFAGLVTDALET